MYRISNFEIPQVRIKSHKYFNNLLMILNEKNNMIIFTGYDIFNSIWSEMLELHNANYWDSDASSQDCAVSVCTVLSSPSSPLHPVTLYITLLYNITSLNPADPLHQILLESRDVNLSISYIVNSVVHWIKKNKQTLWEIT